MRRKQRESPCYTVRHSMSFRRTLQTCTLLTLTSLALALAACESAPPTAAVVEATARPSPTPTRTATSIPAPSVMATPTPAPIPTSTATPMPAEALTRAQEAMERQSFRGAQAFSPSRSESPEAAFTFAPGLTLLQDLGGEWAPYMLLSDEPFFFSSGGVGWSTWNEGSLYGTYFSVIFDPRVALRFATTPEITGEEIIDGRTYLIMSTGLDLEAILDMAPPEQPYVHITLSFPYPEGADAEGLERLGYEVFGSLPGDSAVWEAFKGPYQLSFRERGRRGQPRKPMERIRRGHRPGGHRTGILGEAGDTGSSGGLRRRPRSHRGRTWHPRFSLHI